MGELIAFPLNELMEGFYIEEYYRDYYDEECYYVNYEQDAEINIEVEQQNWFKRIIKKFFCRL